MLGQVVLMDMYESIDNTELFSNTKFSFEKQTLLFVSTNNNTLQYSSTTCVERKTRFIRNGNDDVLKLFTKSPVYGLNVRI
jgi:hypothetical protein